MQKWLIAILCALASCSSNSHEESSEAVDVQTQSNSKDTTVHGSSDGWEEHGGYKLKRNKKIQEQLGGQLATRWFQTTNGALFGGTTRMELFENGEITVYSNVKPPSGNGEYKEVSDTGTFAIFEDTKGQVFLQFQMQMSGEGFVGIQFKEGKIWLTGPGGTEIFTLQPLQKKPQ